jgi:hypothetical protein
MLVAGTAPVGHAFAAQKGDSSMRGLSLTTPSYGVGLSSGRSIFFYAFAVLQMQRCVYEIGNEKPVFVGYFNLRHIRRIW